jgi:integrase
VSLYKRGGVWWSYIWVHNVRHGRSLKTSNKREAVLREIQFRKDLEFSRQNHSFKPEMKFRELATRFMGSASAKPYYIERTKALLSYFADTPLCEITRPLADEFRRHRKDRAAVKDATVNRDLEAMRRILFWAVDEGILVSNPLSRVKMVPTRRVRQPVLAPSEEPRLLAVAAKHLKPLIIAAVDTGMRRGELFAQRAEDVDLVRKVLFVTHSKTPGGEQREIPLTSRMQTLLKELPQAGPLFTYHGEQLEKLRRSWETAVAKSGVRPLLFKHLRHTFNTRLMEAGVIQDVRMSLMGHSHGRPRTTNDIYTHVETHVLREAIAKLEDWLARQQAAIEAEEAISTEVNNDEGE